MRLIILSVLFLILNSCNYRVNIHQTDDSYHNEDIENEEISSLINTEYQDTTLDFSEGDIYFKNPSFEYGTVRYSSLPDNWRTCENDQSPPDLHSNFEKHFNVTQSASDGKNFVGMVVRDDKTQENISQMLESPLENGSIYAFNVDLSKSQQLNSLSKTTMKLENFNQPTILKVWGGRSPCDKSNLLFETMLIDHLEWKTYTIEFTAQENHTYLILEASFSTDEFYPYNGNLLIDNLSPIKKID